MWAMWGHTFTNYNSPFGELWHKVVPFSVLSTFFHFGDNEPIFPISIWPNDHRIYPVGDSELSILGCTENSNNSFLKIID